MRNMRIQQPINLLLIEQLRSDFEFCGFRILNEESFIEVDGYFAIMAVVGVTNRLPIADDIITVHWDAASDVRVRIPRFVPSIVERVYWAVLIRVPVGCVRIGWIKTDNLDSNTGEGTWIDLETITTVECNKLLLIETSEDGARGIQLRYAVGALQVKGQKHNGVRLLYVENVPQAEYEEGKKFGVN
jgi:hypothetical protein